MLESLSARRAWIEISVLCTLLLVWLVALRKESVDRNTCHLNIICVDFIVALRKESVDRNACPKSLLIAILCRSPQGERG